MQTSSFEIEALKHLLTIPSIAKQEKVFGNNLANVPRSKDLSGPSDKNTLEHDIPAFVVKSIRKIEPMISMVGIYRINGVASAVHKIRYVFSIFSSSQVCLNSHKLYSAHHRLRVNIQFVLFLY